LKHLGAESKSSSNASWSSHLFTCSVSTSKKVGLIHHNCEAGITEQITIFLENYMQSN
jgi:hypothetical protein